MAVAVGFDHGNDAGFVADRLANGRRVVAQRGVINFRPAAVRGHQERALRASMKDFTQSAMKTSERIANAA